MATGATFCTVRSALAVLSVPETARVTVLGMVPAASGLTSVPVMVMTPPSPCARSGALQA